MLSLSRWFALAAVALVPLPASAQFYCPPAVVTPAPTVALYTPATAVTYYTPATVVAYSPPVVAYSPPVVAAAPVTVSTYRYGLFGRRSVTTVGYGAPVVVAPRRVAYVYP